MNESEHVRLEWGGFFARKNQAQKEFKSMKQIIRGGEVRD